jgi:hypothetical protein
MPHLTPFSRRTRGFRNLRRRYAGASPRREILRGAAVIPPPLDVRLKDPGRRPTRLGALFDRGHPSMNRNVLYLIIAALGVPALVQGCQFHQEPPRTTGIQIDVGSGGVSTETK